MLVEKAYAKMYGSYPNIEGGRVDEALADLTNGAPYRFDLSDPDVQQMYNSGQVRYTLLTMIQRVLEQNGLLELQKLPDGSWISLRK